jgi:hypothetical protein
MTYDLLATDGVNLQLASVIMLQLYPHLIPHYGCPGTPICLLSESPLNLVYYYV